MSTLVTDVKPEPIRVTLKQNKQTETFWVVGSHKDAVANTIKSVFNGPKEVGVVYNVALSGKKKRGPKPKVRVEQEQPSAPI